MLAPRTSVAALLPSARTFLAGLAAVALTIGCGGSGTSGDPSCGAPGSHTVLDSGGRCVCESGYTWRDPSDPTDPRCVPDGTCEPSCDGLACGDDGCGGSCGACDVGQACEAGRCVSCAADCGGSSCGDDGCGGSCGTCDVGQACSAGQCVDGCVPACDGSACGDDGCGGTCACAGGARCVAEQCVSIPAAWTCSDTSFDADDGCHCGCGAYDPDCDDPEAPVLGCSAAGPCGGDGECPSDTDDKLIVTRTGSGGGGVILRYTQTLGDEPDYCDESECTWPTLRPWGSGSYTLEAVADPDSRFVGYRGDCVGHDDDFSLSYLHWTDSRIRCEVVFDRVGSAEGWARHFVYSGRDEELTGLAADDTALYFVSHRGNATDSTLHKVDLLGRSQWRRVLSPRDYGEARLDDLCVGADGTVVAVGAFEVEGDHTDGWLVALDAQGEQIWDQLRGTDGSDELRGVTCLADGGVVATGGTGALLEDPADIWVVAYDAARRRAWEVTLDSLGDAGAWERGVAIAQVAGGFVVAAENLAGNGQVTLVKLGPTGALLGQTTLASSRWLNTPALSVVDGVVYALIPSVSTDLGEVRAVVAAFDSDLDPLWNARFADGTDLIPRSIFAASGGRLIVGAGLDEGRLVTVDAADGDLVASRRVAVAGGFATPVAGGDVVMAGVASRKVDFGDYDGFRAARLVGGETCSPFCADDAVENGTVGEDAPDLSLAAGTAAVSDVTFSDRAGDSRVGAWGDASGLYDCVPVTLEVQVDASGAGGEIHGPDGQRCSDHCFWAVRAGDTVELAAVPDSGARFVGWSHSAVPPGPVISVTMDSRRYIAAAFSAANVEAGGSVTSYAVGTNPDFQSFSSDPSGRSILNVYHNKPASSSGQTQLVAIGTSGEILWHHHIKGTFDLFGGVAAVSQDAYFFADYDAGLVTMQFAPDGSVDWQTSHTAGLYLSLTHARPHSAGWYVVGRSVEEGAEVVVTKVDGRGDHVWTKLIDGTPDHTIVMDAIVLGDDGVVLNLLRGDSSESMLKLSSAGALEWERAVGIDGADAGSVFPTSIAPLGADGVLVTVYYEATAREHAAVVAVGDAGQVLWAYSLLGAGVLIDDAVATPCGGDDFCLLVDARYPSSWGFSESVYLLRGSAASGTLAWQRPFGGQHSYGHLHLTPTRSGGVIAGMELLYRDIEGLESVARRVVASSSGAIGHAPCVYDADPVVPLQSRAVTATVADDGSSVVTDATVTSETDTRFVTSTQTDHIHLNHCLE